MSDAEKELRERQIDAQEQLFVEFREQTADMPASGISEINDMLRDILNILE